MYLPYNACQHYLAVVMVVILCSSNTCGSSSPIRTREYTIGNNIYRLQLYEEFVTWHTAYDKCQIYTSQLAVLADRRLVHVMSGFFNDSQTFSSDHYHVWVAGKRNRTENVCYLDGSPYKGTGRYYITYYTWMVHHIKVPAATISHITRGWFTI